MKRNSAIVFLSVLLALCATAATRTLLDKNWHIHSVKKGESLYGIAKSNGWDYDSLVKYNPGVAAGTGKGQQVWYPADTLPQITVANTKVSHSDTILYVLGYGETLYDVSQRNRTSVEDIFRLNPGLTEQTATGGTVIRIVPNLMLKKAKVNTDTVTIVRGFNQYKVQKGDTWFGIAQRRNIPMEVLIQANGLTPENAPLKKGEYISIPLLDTVAVPSYTLPVDMREQTPSGRISIRDSLYSIATSDSILQLAMLLNVKSNIRRDAEFLKGFMLAADSLKSTRKISIKVIDVSADSLGLPNIIASNQLDSLDVIICTEDTDFPAELNTFGHLKGTYIINPFCLSDTACLHNPMSVQMLPATEFFNQSVADGIIKDFEEHRFIFLGNSREKELDPLSAYLKQRLTAAGIKTYSIADIPDLNKFKFAEAGRYVILSNAKSTEDVENELKSIAELQSMNPLSEFAVIGRPSWITQIEKLKEPMGKVNTFIPSRFYADDNSPMLGAFIEKFKENFGHKPQHAWPVFSYFGYDLGMWLMENYRSDDCKIPIGNTPSRLLQTDFKVTRPSGMEGFMNTGIYLINVTPYNTIEKNRY